MAVPTARAALFSAKRCGPCIMAGADALVNERLDFLRADAKAERIVACSDHPFFLRTPSAPKPKNGL